MQIRISSPFPLPPRSRGWTLVPVGCPDEDQASPALAGMDLLLIVEIPADQSFPRARGDGPASLVHMDNVDKLPPRSRGWTPRPRSLRRGSAASPALAGMDRRVITVPLRPNGFPRARGDGPSAPNCTSNRAKLPPRSRGWTRGRCGRSAAALASPALAGMDPTTGKSCSSQEGSPPRSRGWTRHGWPAHRSRRASPALAGMDPPWPMPRWLSDGFPRARGDGPAKVSAAIKAFVLPPRSRRWTRVWADATAGSVASPALAGMDLKDIRAAPPHHRFPRARGDGPQIRHASLGTAALPPRSRGWTVKSIRMGEPNGASPALAGMDPLETAQASHSSRFPRARGDGPACGALGQGGVVLPPRSRGWTLVPRRPRRRRRASPALAGMDLGARHRNPTAQSFPRARGDGPGAGCCSAAASQLPRARWDGPAARLPQRFRR